MDLVRISRELGEQVDQLRFESPVVFVYNPLRYAREPHERYLKKWGGGTKRVLFVGMNPGPFGMAQTGVPFGDVRLVRDFLGITGRVESPARVHEKRPIQGFDCGRSEVSGTRLWGWVRDRFKEPQRFFEQCFVHNYCPLVFMEESSKNRTPDKLAKAERDALYAVCDTSLARVVQALKPKWVVGIGAFAEQRANKALTDAQVRIGTILHPSPASPKANKGWAGIVEGQLHAYGLGKGVLW